MVTGILKGPQGGPRGPKDRSLGQAFFENARKNGDKIFQIDADTGKYETFEQVKNRSVPVALALIRLGVGAEDVILLCCKNNADNIVPALAAWFIGASVASVDPKQQPYDVRRSLNIVEPKVLFVVEDAVPLIEESLKDFEIVPVVIVIGRSEKYKTMENMLGNNGDEIGSFEPVKIKKDQTAVIIFSSGTTSTPKGICMSHFSLLYGMHGLSEHFGYNLDVCAHLSSLFWISGAMVSGWCIAKAKTKVVGSGITGEKFLELADKYKMTYAFTSGEFTYSVTNLAENVIAKYDTSSFQVLHLGGATMDPKQVAKVRSVLKHTKVTLAYGSSEAHYVTAFDLNCQKAYEEKLVSSGTPVPDVQLKFVDVETRTLVGPNQQGELLIKSPYLSTGYHKLDKPDSFDEEGFLKQGDLGYYDEDGYVYVTDRISETFKYQLFHVSPALIEEVFQQHPSVHEAVVFGVPHHGDRFHPAACVVPKKGSDIDVDELIEFVNARVSDSHRIRAGVKVVGSLSRTLTGKIQRRSAKEQFLNIQKC
ncbi:luciferin 4-monooxygenase-like [Cylas formicarius]|uniref:luciferin 4-monooxygenase-like n=1 Tax=Cylas formicarius TaxID=197179 RepID=UPI0029586CEC|nr:luciferin 4-monooxygenase-like [Cylas formicarius]